jgi:hypothetical protein
MVDGRTLHFRLAGINNQNFIMRDEETGSWWQQVSGEAILGPLAGRRLNQVNHDELSFGLWKHETPQGRVLKPVDAIAAAGRYENANWEEEVARLPVVTSPEDRRLEPREVVVGVTVNGESRAYPLRALRKQSPVVDTIAGVPIIILVARDRKSVRAFQRLVEGRELQFFSEAESASETLVDIEGGSRWDFTGRAISGPLMGRRLERVQVLIDYWFDWKTYHPGSQVDMRGAVR